MSTRAVYTFIDDMGTHHVYKHHDGYPRGAVEWITAALPYAWPLPRFEADDFAAAFVAANKEGVKPGDPPMYQGGGVRLTHGYDRHGDLEYRYEIRCVDGKLQIKVFDVPGEGIGEEIFVGTIEMMSTWVKK